MCANYVDVYSKASSPGAVGYKWSSEGTGSFEIQECDDVDVGTKIVIQLKPECREYADENRIREVVKKYSNFVGSPIFLNGNQLNIVQPLWLMDAKDISEEQHIEFYRYIANSFDTPRFNIHFKTDVPVTNTFLYFVENYSLNFLLHRRFRFEPFSIFLKANRDYLKCQETPTLALHCTLGRSSFSRKQN